MDSKHTPTPWMVEGSHWIIPAAHSERVIGGSTNKDEHVSRFAHVIAKVEQDEKRFTHEQVEANAEFIVRACNSFHSMRLALVMVADTIAFQFLEPQIQKMVMDAIAEGYSK